MNKNWSDIAWQDYLALQNDKKLLKKANELLKDIDRNGYTGLGKPEPLKGEKKDVLYQLRQSDPGRGAVLPPLRDQMRQPRGRSSAGGADPA